MNYTYEQIIIEVEKQGGNKTLAANELGLARGTLRKAIDKRRGVGIYAKDKSIDNHVDHGVSGLTPNAHEPDAKMLWNELEQKQKAIESQIKERYKQTVEIPDSKPVGIALFSDLHIGNAKCLYSEMRRDAELVRDTPGMYGICAGDYAENWIGKLSEIARLQNMDFDSECALVEQWFEWVDGKLLCVLSGNHDNRTRKIAGLDRIRSILKGAQLLYDRDEINFTIKFGKQAQWKVKARHKWKGRSVYNPTHGLEVDLQRGGCDYDIAIGGHTHIGTLFREFIFHSQRRLACLIGTYKGDDVYARELGFAPSVGRGCGALILWPDGRMHSSSDLQTTAQILKAVRQ